MLTETDIYLKSALQNIWQYIETDTVTEIYVNEDRHVWVDDFQKGRYDTKVDLSVEDINTINRTVAGGVENYINPDNPELAAEIYGLGFRFQAVVPPLVKSPVFMIRKRPTRVFSLAEYVDNATISQQQKIYIENAITERRNILLIGATGSGKTTFLNALLLAVSQLTPDHRLLILEDTAELQCTAKDHLCLKTTQNKQKVVDMEKLLFITMRLSPTRIIIGEVRDKSAYAMLCAWNTGHQGGISTTHADDCINALSRLEVLARQDPQAGDCRGLIGSSVDIVISIQKLFESEQTKRLVTEIIEVDNFDYQSNQYNYKTIFNYKGGISLL